MVYCWLIDKVLDLNNPSWRGWFLLTATLAHHLVEKRFMALASVVVQQLFQILKRSVEYPPDERLPSFPSLPATLKCACVSIKSPAFWQKFVTTGLSVVTSFDFSNMGIAAAAMQWVGFDFLSSYEKEFMDLIDGMFISLQAGRTEITINHFNKIVKEQKPFFESSWQLPNFFSEFLQAQLLE